MVALLERTDVWKRRASAPFIGSKVRAGQGLDFDWNLRVPNAVGHKRCHDFFIEALHPTRICLSVIV